MIKKADIFKNLKGLDNIILMIKARGGWKFREKVRASDVEIDRIIGRAEQDLRMIVLQNMVALDVLEEWGKMGHFKAGLQRLIQDVAEGLAEKSAK